MQAKRTKNESANLRCLFLFTRSQFSINIISYFSCVRAYYSITTLILVILCVSCEKQHSTSLTYKTSEDAIKEYKQLHEKLCLVDSVTTEKLCEEVKEWVVMDTAVTRSVFAPDKKDACSYCIKDYENTRDSIVQEFNRLILTSPRTYRDAVLLMEAASPLMGDTLLDSAMKNAQPFFDSLQQDSITEIQDSQQELSKYRNFLIKQIKQGIHNKQDMLSFIKEEHKYFTKYLVYMDSLREENTNDIIYNTERCCRMIFQAVGEGSIDELDALVYMTIRNNKRLLLNALVCVDNVWNGQITTTAQAKTYELMILKPYISLSPISIALLYPSDRIYFLNIADATAKTLATLNNFTGWHDRLITELPYIFMNWTITNTK